VVDLNVYTNSDRMITLFQSRLPQFQDSTLIVSACRIPRVRWYDKDDDKLILRACYLLDVVDTKNDISGAEKYMPMSFDRAIASLCINVLEM
jgi:hypothetical protein